MKLKLSFNDEEIKSIREVGKILNELERKLGSDAYPANLQENFSERVCSQISRGDIIDIENELFSLISAELSLDYPVHDSDSDDENKDYSEENEDEDEDEEEEEENK